MFLGYRHGENTIGLAKSLAQLIVLRAYQPGTEPVYRRIKSVGPRSMGGCRPIMLSFRSLQPGTIFEMQSEKNFKPAQGKPFSPAIPGTGRAQGGHCVSRWFANRTCTRFSVSEKGARTMSRCINNKNVCIKRFHVRRKRRTSFEPKNSVSLLIELTR